MVGDYLDGLIQELFVSSAIASFKVLRREVGEDDGYFRIKCKLANGDILEFAEYVQIRKNKIYTETYSFHWQSAEGKLIKRWDNVGHHKEVDTHPHHLHLPDGAVISSRLMNLKRVLTDIEKTMNLESENR